MGAYVDIQAVSAGEVRIVQDNRYAIGGDLYVQFDVMDTQSHGAGKGRQRIFQMVRGVAAVRDQYRLDAAHAGSHFGRRDAGTLYRRSIKVSLFVAQGIYGIEVCGLGGGQNAEDNTGAARHAEGERDGPTGHMRRRETGDERDGKQAE